MKQPAPVPTAIKLHRQSHILELHYADGTQFQLACEYLRVFSPSAEVMGHGGGEPIIVPGKRKVSITRIDPIGQYAVRLVFDDGHSTGLYSWDVLWELGSHQDAYWAHYLERLAQHGLSRDSEVTKLSALPPKKWKPPTS